MGFRFCRLLGYKVKFKNLPVGALQSASVFRCAPCVEGQDMSLCWWFEWCELCWTPWQWLALFWRGKRPIACCSFCQGSSDLSRSSSAKIHCNPTVQHTLAPASRAAASLFWGRGAALWVYWKNLFVSQKALMDVCSLVIMLVIMFVSVHNPKQPSCDKSGWHEWETGITHHSVPGTWFLLLTMHQRDPNLNHP